MQVTPYRDDYLPDITCLINQHTKQVAPFCTFDEAQIDALIHHSKLPWSVHYPDESAIDYLSPVICVVNQKRVQAAAQWMVTGAQCILLWLVAMPPEPQALQALLHRCLNEALRQGANQILTSRNVLGTGWFGIPVTRSHLIRGMQIAGFSVTGRWVLLSADIDAVLSTGENSPDISGLHLEWQHRPAHGEWRVSAFQRQQLIGQCDTWHLPPLFENCPQAKTAITIEAIDIHVSVRRRGLAQYLLSRQLQMHRTRGKNRVVATTEISNTAARTLCRKLNFTEMTQCLEFRQSLFD
jgi:ribosomal protein S18 acetylase RimI-like enzyme